MSLTEIIVSSTRPVSEAATTVHLVSAEEITALGARTLDEALVLVPGLNVRTGADGVPRVDMRGLRTRHVTLLLNGIPFNGTDDGQFDPSLIPVEEIAAIKVTGGTGSALYGAGGLGGVINVITRTGGGTFKASATGELRQVGSRLARGSVSGGSGALSIVASGSAADANPFPSWDASPTLGTVGPSRRVNSDRNRRNGFLQADLAAGHRGRVGLTLSGVTGQQGDPPSIIADTSDVFANRPVYDRTDHLHGLAAQLAADFVLDAGWSARAWTFRNAQHSEVTRYADAALDPAEVLVASGTSRDTIHTRLTGAGAQVGIGIVPVGQLTVGLSAAHDAWDETSLVVGGGGGGGGGGMSVQSSTVDVGLWRYGVALEYSWRPTERLAFVSGLMHDRMRQTGRTESATGYTAGITLQATARTAFRASAARRYRFPTLRQLHDRVSGNLDLAPERADMIEAGLRQDLPATIQVSLVAYQTVARNFIEKDESSGLFQNAERYRFRGVEIQATATPRDGVSVQAGYDFLDADDQSAGRGGLTLQYRPRHRITAGARWTSPWGMVASGSLEHVAGEVYQSRRGPLQLADLPAYTVAGVRLGQHIARGALDVYAGVDNLFNAAYEEAYGFPRERRTAYVGLTVQP